MKIQVLDHGYVEFVESWGTGVTRNHEDYERGIIEAARQSTQGLFRGWDQDQKLLKFLYNNKHLTPFEFAGMIIEVQAPIFVFREWHRHRTQSYNEMSARYAPLPDLYYEPRYERLFLNAGTTNKQANGVTSLDPDKAVGFTAQLDQLYKHAEDVYQRSLEMGIPKELARLVMPVGHYSRMRASANLRNWLQFLTLRLDPAAQWEIRQYAQAVAQIIKAYFPQTYDLFMEVQNEH